MILVNTTFSVGRPQADKFIEFLRDTYAPLAGGAGMYNILITEMREREDAQNSDTRTIALQMRAPSQKVLDAFAEDYLPKIYGYIGRTWGQDVALFETVLDVVHDSEKANDD